MRFGVAILTWLSCPELPWWRSRQCGPPELLGRPREDRVSAVRALWALSGLYLRGNIHYGAFLPVSNHFTGDHLGDVDYLLHVGIEHPAEVRTM